MKVLKFGGTVLKNSSNIKNVGKIIHQQLKNDEKNIIVISAFFGITNKLLELATIASNKKDFSSKFTKIKEFHLKIVKQLSICDNTKKQVLSLFKDLNSVLKKIQKSHKLSLELQDVVLSFGERLSSLIVFHYLLKTEKVVQIFPDEIIKTNSDFGCASVNLSKSYKLIKNCIKNKKENIIVCAGFFASNDNGNITTLGRNAGDYTAAIVASAINADVLEIWKDTCLYTADPKIVKNAKIIKNIKYDEMYKLSLSGNKVLHPLTVKLCALKKIPIAIKDCNNPLNAGTLIS